MSQPTRQSQEFMEAWELLMEPRKYLAKSLAILDSMPTAEELEEKPDDKIAEWDPMHYDDEPVEVCDE